MPVLRQWLNPLCNSVSPYLKPFSMKIIWTLWERTKKCGSTKSFWKKLWGPLSKLAFSCLKLVLEVVIWWFYFLLFYLILRIFHLGVSTSWSVKLSHVFFDRFFKLVFLLLHVWLTFLYSTSLLTNISVFVVKWWCIKLASKWGVRMMSNDQMTFVYAWHTIKIFCPFFIQSSKQLSSGWLSGAGLERARY